MACNPRLRLMTCALSLLAVTSCTSAARAEPSSPEARAIVFLAREVPQWAAKNHCYSCHNNGDAARALIMAFRAGLLEDRQPLIDTLAFLRAPAEWDTNGPEGPFKDKKLARIQFATALVESSADILSIDRPALVAAGALVAELQQPDGSWQTDAEGTIGSPVTYGQPLATYFAAGVLGAADAGRYREAIDKSRQWFKDHPPQNILSAAATLLALRNGTDEKSTMQRATALDLIVCGQSTAGGWGPFVTAPPEVFDTALVLLALRAQQERSPELQSRIDRGRKYLLDTQEADGSWAATTRPPGVESYAQRMSTTGWATQALIVTRPSAVK